MSDSSTTKTLTISDALQYNVILACAYESNSYSTPTDKITISADGADALLSSYPTGSRAKAMLTLAFTPTADTVTFTMTSDPDGTGHPELFAYLIK